jgi:uncharacterized protein (DUF58 family)
MDTVSILKKVRRLEIKTKAITKDLFSGDYHSAFKGRGMSFSEVREYTYGDDVRNIDWNVTARTSTPFVKVFEEERELTLMLLIDVSASVNFGTQSKQKDELTLEMAAVLAFSAMGNQDKVGAIFFSNKVEKYIAPKKGKQNILHIIRTMIGFTPQNPGTDLCVALDFLNNVQKKKSICFVLSDFVGLPFEKSLRLTSKKHDVIGLFIFDQREKTLPDVGLIEVTDPETSTTFVIDSGNKKFRNRIYLLLLNMKQR